MTFQEFVEALQHVRGKEILRRYLTEDSCINTTRILLDVAWSIGVEPRPEPFACRVMVFSPGLVQWVTENSRVPSPDEMHQMALNKPHIHSVGIGFSTIETQAGRWPGHLIMRCGDDALDGTIAQASRPRNRILLPDMLYFKAVPEFWRGGSGVTLNYVGNGCLLKYEARPNLNSFITTPGWNRIDEGVVREIARAIETHRRARRWTKAERPLEADNAERTGQATEPTASGGNESSGGGKEQ